MTPEAVGQDDSEAAGNDNADEKSKAATAAAKQPLWKKPQKKKAGKKQVCFVRMQYGNHSNTYIRQIYLAITFCSQRPFISQTIGCQKSGRSKSGCDFTHPKGP